MPAAAVIHAFRPDRPGQRRGVPEITPALPLFAHSWYDPACCGGQDCAPIPSITVTAGPDGWHVRLGPGDHPMVTRGVLDAVVPYDEALPSQDGAFHACVRDQSSPSNVMADPIICLYVPDIGSV